PIHAIASQEEVNKILKKYKIRVDQLPLISRNDPVVHLLGARNGDVVRVKRTSPTAGEVSIYRYVDPMETE
ncbi:MAG: DNA-directed RNA polymerase subunit H, partial [Candidatus Ranarchaeia archaeon]